MSNAIFNVPQPKNEPVKGYGPGSPEKKAIKAELEKQRKNPVHIPVVIGGEPITDREQRPVVSPHQHKRVVAHVCQATEDDVDRAIATSLEARRAWATLPWEDRASVFLKAADLLATKYRPVLNAATMLGQSKTIQQAEIDSACELIDFWRFNVHYMEQLYREQPISDTGIWNRVVQRGLEGFVFAVTPFNFTAIGLNLPTAPVLMGCSVAWKPAHTSMLSSYWGMKVLEEAGLPPGVINFIPGKASMIGAKALDNPNLAGVHFTGSTSTFQYLWKTIGQNIDKYKTYPRVVGETGGKDFIFAHKSADRQALMTALVRGAFEYQGQKCSAASRAYIPKSVWTDIKDDLVSQVRDISMGDVEDFTNFMGAVIDEPSFTKIKEYIDHARGDADSEILVGGECDDSVGYFIRPTIILTKNPRYRSMCEEIFGPVLSIYVYDDNKMDEAVKYCDEATSYGLTGAIFAQDRMVINKLTAAFEHAAGNFYINDKPTGAVVGQQPFGGSRASGTNDKAGSKLNLIRWTSVRTIKENFIPPTDYRYPHMLER